MSYTPTNWENLPSTNTPINATNLNNIETGLDNLQDLIIYRDVDISVTTIQDGFAQSSITPPAITGYTLLSASIINNGFSYRPVASITTFSTSNIGVTTYSNTAATVTIRVRILYIKS